MSFDGFDEADFADIALHLTQVKRAKIQLALNCSRMGMGLTHRLIFSMQPELLARINGADQCFALQWAQAKGLFRIKVDPAGSYKLKVAGQGGRRRLFCVPPVSGFFFRVGQFEPKFHVDTAGRAILVECPDVLRCPAATEGGA